MALPAAPRPLPGLLPAGRLVVINCEWSILNFRRVLHELGHNLGLAHTSANGQEYGDTSCIMWVCFGAVLR